MGMGTKGQPFGGSMARANAFGAQLFSRMRVATVCRGCRAKACGDRKVEAWARWAEKFPMSAAIVSGAVPTKLDVVTQQRHMAIEQWE